MSVAALVTCAATANDGPPDTVGASTALKLDLIGIVPSHCGFKTAPPQSNNLGDIGQAGSLTLPFTLDCNATFDVRVSSQNGGLAHVGAVTPPAGFAALLDYDVKLSVGTDLGTVNGECVASALVSGCAIAGPQGYGLSSGDGVAVGADAQLTLHWTPPASHKLLAGSYQDSITITVEARS